MKTVLQFVDRGLFNFLNAQTIYYILILHQMISGQPILELSMALLPKNQKRFQKTPVEVVCWRYLFVQLEIQ